MDGCIALSFSWFYNARMPIVKKTRLFCLLVFVSFFLVHFSCRRDSGIASPAELILEKASVYTQDEMRPWAEAVAIAGGRIVYVGASPEASKFKGKGTKVIDLSGKMVLPGFHDSHVHLVTGGIELGQCNLNGLATREEILAKIRDYALAHPEKPWIAGGGWDLPIFPGANPTKEELDGVVRDRPAYLSAADGHSAWVNSRALEIAGVSVATPDPENGRIERIPGSLEPSGTLREAAMRLVRRFIPEPTPEEYEAGLLAGLALANRFGITSIIEASADDDILNAYEAADRSKRLTVRVLASIHVDTDRGIEQIEDLVEKMHKFRGQYLRATAAKIFADGVIESHTAALLEPYIDRPGDRGKPLLEQAAFDRLAINLDKAGFQIHIHAIGDRAVRMSLNALEAARTANGPGDARHHIAHLELVDPADIPRFQALGVVANFQPLWAYPDLYITRLTEPILGPERSRRIYPIGSLVRNGALVVGGSDWSVSSLNPLEAIQVAVTRRAPGDSAGAAWLPEELIDLPTALAAYTINGAYLSHQEEITGSIETGKAADLVVLDRNLFEIPSAEIHQVKVRMTLIDGKIVFSAAD
jgi:predicted amidohydrolase YtcJ